MLIVFRFVHQNDQVVRLGLLRPTSSNSQFDGAPIFHFNTLLLPKLSSITPSTVMDIFEISARNWELLAWCLVGSVLAIAYFRHCSKKAASPALPPRLVRFSPPRQERKEVTKHSFGKGGGGVKSLQACALI